MNLLSLCSGICGIELGLKLVIPNLRIVGYVEYDNYCQEIIKARIQDGVLDDVPIFADLFTFRGEQYRGVAQLITAGFPCQPFSVAGKRKGANDERNLWPEVARVIGEVQPAIVFLENVPAVGWYYYTTVRPQLQDMGYSVTEGIFSAAEVGAPHRRERLFILAHASSTRRRGRYAALDKGQEVTYRGSEDVADTLSHRDANNGQGQTSREATAGQRAITERKRVRTDIGQRSNYGGGDWWAVEPSLGRVADGIPARVGQLRAYGNAVVPQVAAKAWCVLMDKIV